MYYEPKTGFGFSIPDGATITGILVEWIGTSDADNGLNSYVLKAYVAGLAGVISQSSWNSGSCSSGGSGDLWGTTWTPSDINNNGFGAEIREIHSDAWLHFACTTVTITVYYTEAPPPENPGAFDLSTPSDGSTGRAVSGSLIWQESAGADTYDVYFGENNPPTIKVSDAQSGTSYAYSGLDTNKTYYWKVVATNVNGSTECNKAFSFTTVLPLPPGPFTLHFPPNGSKNQPLTGTLSWGESLGATGYDVYMGQVNPPVTLVSSDQSETYFLYGSSPPLQENKTYYWKIIARNAAGTKEGNKVFSFTTYENEPGTGKIMAFCNDPDNYRAYSYLSKRYKYRACAFNCGKVLAASYPVYLDIIYPEIPHTTSVVVADGNPFRIEDIMSEAIEFRVTGEGAVYAIFIAGDMKELPA